ncbi:MAG: shikimate kinase [Pirellulaceae bacterium]|jgi:shikimate kinase|nr:shikimate kinase [Pirellulaceae bacterium]MDP6556674.1 shikimate kinase [Pirellulaceae bacterium]MDP6718307.1 shikimate kinase [Pirellulaceae bacterium]
MNVALIGYRGTGKTTVAKLLADRLGWTVVDTDDLIELRAGKSIRRIFDEDGEIRFRDLEVDVIRQAVQSPQQVLALGGGAVLREETRQILSACKVVWLQADAQTLAARISGDPVSGNRRPDLTTAGGFAEIQELLAQRQPVYQETADYSVDTSKKSPEQLADEIVSLLGDRQVGEEDD